MGRFLILAVCALCASSAPARAQTSNAPKPGHERDFDYLLGDWQFVAMNKQYGRTEGRWSAARLATGQILDEYRLVDGKGGTIYVTATIRNYNAKSGKWELIGMDGSNGLLDFGTAERVGSEIHIEQRFGVAGGKPTTLRIRYTTLRLTASCGTPISPPTAARRGRKTFSRLKPSAGVLRALFSARPVEVALVRFSARMVRPAAAVFFVVASWSGPPRRCFSPSKVGQNRCGSASGRWARSRDRRGVVRCGCALCPTRRGPRQGRLIRVQRDDRIQPASAGTPRAQLVREIRVRVAASNEPEQPS